MKNIFILTIVTAVVFAAKTKKPAPYMEFPKYLKKMSNC